MNGRKRFKHFRKLQIKEKSLGFFKIRGTLLKYEEFHSSRQLIFTGRLIIKQRFTSFRSFEEFPSPQWYFENSTFIYTLLMVRLITFWFFFRWKSLISPIHLPQRLLSLIYFLTSITVSLLENLSWLLVVEQFNFRSRAWFSLNLRKWKLFTPN